MKKRFLLFLIMIFLVSGVSVVSAALCKASDGYYYDCGGYYGYYDDYRYDDRYYGDDRYCYDEYNKRYYCDYDRDDYGQDRYYDDYRYYDRDYYRNYYDYPEERYYVYPRTSLSSKEEHKVTYEDKIEDEWRSEETIRTVTETVETSSKSKKPYRTLYYYPYVNMASPRDYYNSRYNYQDGESRSFWYDVFYSPRTYENWRY